jgi:ABC-2 type transport system ATP-binding protein
MLSVQGVSKRFGEVDAMREVTFDVAPGRITGFLGRNGAGKTTTMRTVFGLVTPDSGRVTIDGESISSERRLRFGYMPEERGLYPRMKVRDQLIYFGRLSGMTGSEAASGVDRWLAEFDLSDRSDARLEELSHGNQQRIQLTAAILHDPDVLVLDEPFAGLDPVGVESLGTVLGSFSERGAAILFSSHQLDLVEYICEDVVIIHQGSVVVQGSLDTIRHAASYRRVEIWVDDVLWDPPIGTARRVGSGSRSHHIIDASVDVEAVLRLAQASGTITRFSFEPPALSDIFREAVTT